MALRRSSRLSSNKRVIVAMSGGVDSSVSAAILKRHGYDAIGISIKLWPKEECGYHKPTSCCSLEAISDARLVAERLGIPFYVVDFHKEFKKEVIDYFSSEYLAGRTPNPCILCNEKIKFGILLRKADELDARHVATGHYAGVIRDKKSGRYLLTEARDKKKDQSYTLFRLSQEQLGRALFPLSGLKKDAVRKKARALGLAVHNKRESQDICFVQDKYVNYLSGLFKDSIKPGPVLDEEGKRLGTHKGIPFYTIGQREGLGIAYRHALYVLRIDKEKNAIIVGPKEKRFFRNITVSGINWIAGPVKERFRVEVKIRSQHKKAKALLTVKDGIAQVAFDKPQESPTPGQAAVFYDRTIVLGGGWIDSYR